MAGCYLLGTLQRRLRHGRQRVVRKKVKLDLERDWAGYCRVLCLLLLNPAEPSSSSKISFNKHKNKQVCMCERKWKKVLKWIVFKANPHDHFEGVGCGGVSWVMLWRIFSWRRQPSATFPQGRVDPLITGSEVHYQCARCQPSWLELQEGHIDLIRRSWLLVTWPAKRLWLSVGRLARCFAATLTDCFLVYNPIGQWGRFTQSIILQEKYTSRENNIFGPLLQASRKQIEGGDGNAML